MVVRSYEHINEHVVRDKSMVDDGMDSTGYRGCDCNSIRPSLVLNSIGNKGGETVKECAREV